MADYRQQQECEEHHRWTLERGLARMEKDVQRGHRWLDELEAEKQAAKPAQPELELEHD